MVKWLKHMTYRPEIKALARAFGLRRVLRNCYYHWACPSDGILRVNIAGISALFSVNSAGEMRNLDPAGGAQGEQAILQLLASKVRPGDTVYDIGANVGLYSVLLATAVGERGEVIAFEPDGESYAHLQRNLKLNGLLNVRIFRAALGETSGKVKLYLGEIAGPARLTRPCTSDRQYELVKLMEGDALREMENLRVPRVVKIDVEGYEYAVIRGLSRTLTHPSCQLVCCEVHPQLLPAEVKPEQVLNLLKSLGFNRIDTYPRTRDFHAIAYKA